MVRPTALPVAIPRDWRVDIAAEGPYHERMRPYAIPARAVARRRTWPSSVGRRRSL